MWFEMSPNSQEWRRFISLGVDGLDETYPIYRHDSNKAIIYHNEYEDGDYAYAVFVRDDGDCFATLDDAKQWAEEYIVTFNPLVVI